MPDREKVEHVINAFERVIEDFDGRISGPYFEAWMCATKDALALLKAQEAAKAEPKRIELADETKAWLDKMDAVDALGNIADICIDWDGYRTVDGLGGLINEIWAYARYCADKLLKAQEAVEPTRKPEIFDSLYFCGKCSTKVGFQIRKDDSWRFKCNFCPNCGRAVKWE